MRTIKLVAAALAVALIIPASASAAQWYRNGVPLGARAERAIQAGEVKLAVPGLATYDCQVASEYAVSSQEARLLNFGSALCNEGARLTSEAPPGAGTRGGPATSVLVAPSEASKCAAAPLFQAAGFQAWLIIPSQSLEIPLSGKLTMALVLGTKNGLDPSRFEYENYGGTCAPAQPALESPVGPVEATGRSVFDGFPWNELMQWK